MQYVICCGASSRAPSHSSAGSGMTERSGAPSQASVHRDRGSITLEAALVLPVLLLVAMTLLWAMGVAFTALAMGDAVRTSARLIARGESADAAECSRHGRLASRGACLLFAFPPYSRPGGWRRTCRSPTGSGPEGSSPNETGLSLCTLALAHARAGNAADLAAMAAASNPRDPCTSANRVAVANSAELIDCALAEGDVIVRVQVRAPAIAQWLGSDRLEVASRAGPSTE